jgi:hypothetical protein
MHDFRGDYLEKKNQFRNNLCSLGVKPRNQTSLLRVVNDCRNASYHDSTHRYDIKSVPNTFPAGMPKKNGF